MVLLWGDAIVLIVDPNQQDNQIEARGGRRPPKSGQQIGACPAILGQHPQVGRRHPGCRQLPRQLMRPTLEWQDAGPNRVGISQRENAFLLRHATIVTDDLVLP